MSQWLAFWWERAPWYRSRRPVFQPGHRVELLRGGDALFPAMHQAFAQAQREIWLASYIFHLDAAGQALSDALAQAAARGVQVRVVVDGFGSLAALPELQPRLVAAGVGLAVFRPLSRWWHWLQPRQLRRLHQKLCVVDDEVAFVGGINILDDRLDLRHGPSPEPRLDYAVAVRGPVVAAVSQSLQALWWRAWLGRHWAQAMQHWVGRAQQRVTLARLEAPQHRSEGRALPGLADVRSGTGASTSTGAQVAFVLRDNLWQRRSIERACLVAIGQARQRVDLVTPYFYPGRKLRRALVLAARRGVRVRLLLQGKLDYLLAGLAARSLYADLLAQGVEIHEYTPAFLHAKALRVDDEWATVGSSNLDPLSLLLNLEANVVVRDAAFNAELGRALEQALAEATQIVPSTPLPHPGWLGRVGRTAVAVLARVYLRLAGRAGDY